MSNNLLAAPDFVILVVYFVFIAWLGMRFSRNQNADEYFVTTKKIPGWIMGLSMFAATLSCFTFIGFPGWTYRFDMQIMIREYMSIIGIIFCAIFIIPIYRAVVKMSVFEYLEQRYSLGIRLYTSFGIVIGSPVGLGVLLYVLCLALSGLTGIPLIWLILIIGTITLVYTMWGGIEGCIYTEAIHGAMFIGAGLLSLIYLLFMSTPGGVSEIMAVAEQGHKFKLVEPSINLSQPNLFIFVWVGLFHFLNNYSAAPYVVQRYLVAPSYRQAVRGSFLSVLCCLVTWAVFMSIGALLWAYYQINPGLIPKDLEPDKIFPHFIGSALPTGMAGLILAGLLASGMSGISSALNSTSACIQSDWYDRLVKQPDPKIRLMISRGSVLVMGILSVIVAMLLTFWQGGIVQFAADVISSIMGPIIGGGTLAIFFLGLFTRRTTHRGMVAGLVMGILFSTWAITTNPGNPIGKSTSPMLAGVLPAFGWHIWMLFGLSNLVVFVTAYLASLVLDPGKLAPAELTVHGNRIFRAARKAAEQAANEPLAKAGEAAVK